MDSPGYDPVSVTGQVASGANVICLQQDVDLALAVNQFQV